MADAAVADTLNPVQERLRACHERRGETALALAWERQLHQRTRAQLERRMRELRWWVLLVMVILLKEISEPARYMAAYAGSWAYKVAMVALPHGMLMAWLALCAALLVPLILVLWWRPRSAWRERAVRCAAAGLLGASFAFGAMAYVGRRFDAPQAVDSWIFSALECLAIMLLLAAATNTGQNHRRAELAEQDKRECPCG